jgi:hypothetical protein
MRFLTLHPCLGIVVPAALFPANLRAQDVKEIVRSLENESFPVAAARLPLAA